jgi:hypothetical protein
MPTAPPPRTRLRTPVRPMDLEFALDFIGDDELMRSRPRHPHSQEHLD